MTNAALSEFSDGSNTIVEFNLEENLLNTQMIKNQENLIRLDIPELGSQQIVGRPELPMINILLFSELDNTGSDIEIQFSKETVKRKGQLSYFKGQKCRCREIEEYEFNKFDYAAESPRFWIDDFGDYRGKKVIRLNVLVGMQGSSSFELSKNVSIFIPKHYQSLANYDSQNFQSNPSTLIIGLEEHGQLITQYQNKLLETRRDVSVEFVKKGENTQKIKSIIKSHFERKKINNVILVGNDKIIPTFYVDTKFDTQTPSDYQYGIMGGESDSIPDVFIARIPVQSTQELKNVFEKLTSVLNGIHFNKLLGIASNEGANPSDFEYMRNIINPMATAKNATSRFLDQNNLDSNRDTFNSFLENGVDFISYIGHGSGFSWPSFNQQYEIEDLELVEHQKKFPMIIDIACQNGRFSGEGRIGENFFLGGNDHRLIGAAIYYGGSVDISWHPPAVMATGISRFLSQNKNVSIEDALTYGHFYLMNSNTPKEDIIDNLEWYHLQGDPGIIIF